MEAVECTYKLLPELEELGASAELEGELDLKQITKGSLAIKLTEGISYNLLLTNTGRGVLLTGTARTAGVTECARCLEDATIEVEGEVVGYYILHPGEEDEELADDEFIAVGPNGIVDLATPVIAAIIFELPQVILCKEDCAGLCPHCGIDLNEQSCTCADEPPADSPFAALSTLRN
jgi:uncharacterized protein